MKDVILKHIELNEKYHDIKERMAWVASSIYMGFSVLLIRWLLETKHVFDPKWPIMVGLTIVYMCVFCFVLFQFEHRWMSAYKSIELKNVLRISNGRSVYAFPDMLADEVNKEENKKCNKRNYLFIIFLTLVFPLYFAVYLIYKTLGRPCYIADSRYHTEIPTYTILTYFFLAQLYFILDCEIALLTLQLQKILVFKRGRQIKYLLIRY